MPKTQQFDAGVVTTVNMATAVFEETDGRMMATVQIIKAGMSKNRRTYPAALLQKAVETKFFDGSQMFLNHDRSRPDPNQRGMAELMSGIESTEWDEANQAINGRIEFFDKKFYDYAQRAKNYMGVSINALVKGVRRTTGGQVYEDVTDWVRRRSVDWVTTPAAGGAILAFEDEDDNMPGQIDWASLTADEIKKNAPAVYEAIEAEAKAAVEEDPDKEVTPPPSAAEIARLVQEGIEASRKADNERKDRLDSASKQVRAAFERSGLPEKTRARLQASFEGVESYDEAAVTAAITEAKEELKAAGLKGPQVEGMGVSSGSGTGGEAPVKTFSAHESVKSSFLGVTKVADPSKEGTK